MEDTYSYKGWLTSDKYWKRMLSVVTYCIAGTMTAWLVAILALLIISFFMIS